MTSQAIYLTGASSTVGSLVLPLLEKQGVEIMILGRKPIAAGPTASWHQFELTDLKAELPSAMAKTLVHMANLWLLSGWIDKFHSQGVRRILAFSSTSRFTKQTSASSYEQEVVGRLVVAEERLITDCKRLGISWTIFRPTLIYGGAGGDRNVADIARLIRNFGFFPLFGKAAGLRQPVSAKDLAFACIQSLDAPASYNRAYNLSGGETLTYKEMVRRIFHSMGRRPVFVRIPIAVFNMAISIARLHPKLAHLTTDMALRMQVDLVFDHDEAGRDFGYSPGKFDPSYVNQLSS